MTKPHLTNYDHQALPFSKLHEYSVHCGTDYLAVKDAPAMLKEIQPLNKVLDLGCGSGLATRFLKQHFPEAFVIGADINEKMLEQAIASDPQGLYLQFPERDNEILYPFLPSTFDAIVSSFVVHENQTLDELQAFFRNAQNLLRPGGLFLAWDVYKNLFAGSWVSIENNSAANAHIEEGQPYSVKLAPSGACVSGTYWSPETLLKVANSVGLMTQSLSYPLAEQSNDINWKDETQLSPYFVIALKK